MFVERFVARRVLNDLRDRILAIGPRVVEATILEAEKACLQRLNILLSNCQQRWDINMHTVSSALDGRIHADDGNRVMCLENLLRQLEAKANQLDAFAQDIVHLREDNEVRRVKLQRMFGAPYKSHYQPTSKAEDVHEVPDNMAMRGWYHQKESSEGHEAQHIVSAPSEEIKMPVPRKWQHQHLGQDLLTDAESANDDAFLTAESRSGSAMSFSSDSSDSSIEIITTAANSDLEDIHVFATGFPWKTPRRPVPPRGRVLWRPTTYTKQSMTVHTILPQSTQPVSQYRRHQDSHTNEFSRNNAPPIIHQQQTPRTAGFMNPEKQFLRAVSPSTKESKPLLNVPSLTLGNPPLPSKPLQTAPPSIQEFSVVQTVPQLVQNNGSLQPVPPLTANASQTAPSLVSEHRSLPNKYAPSLSLQDNGTLQAVSLSANGDRLSQIALPLSQKKEPLHPAPPLLQETKLSRTLLSSVQEEQQPSAAAVVIQEVKPLQSLSVPKTGSKPLQPASTAKDNAPLEPSHAVSKENKPSQGVPQSSKANKPSSAMSKLVKGSKQQHSAPPPVQIPTPEVSQHSEEEVTKRREWACNMWPSLGSRAATPLPIDILYERLQDTTFEPPRTFSMADAFLNRDISLEAVVKHLSSTTELFVSFEEKDNTHGSLVQFGLPTFLNLCGPGSPEFTGAPGLVLRPSMHDPKMKENAKKPWHAVARIGNPKALRYIGSYKLKPVKPLSLAEWNSLDIKTRTRMIRAIESQTDDKAFLYTKMSIICRRNMKRQPNIYEIHEKVRQVEKKMIKVNIEANEIEAAFNCGNEKVQVWSLEYVNYSVDLQKLLVGYTGGFGRPDDSDSDSDYY